MKPMRTSKRFRIYKEARLELSRTYPRAFPMRGRRPPLKIGILRDLLQQETNILPSKKIRIFLSIWTRSTAYLQSVAMGRERVCLEGQLHEAVDPKHVEEARVLVLERRMNSSKRI